MKLMKFTIIVFAIASSGCAMSSGTKYNLATFGQMLLNARSSYNTPSNPQPGYNTNATSGEYLRVQPNAYGLGIGMDQYGRPTRTTTGY